MGLFAVVLGSLLHDCYIVGTPPAAACAHDTMTVSDLRSGWLVKLQRSGLGDHRVVVPHNLVPGDYQCQREVTGNERRARQNFLLEEKA